MEKSRNGSGNSGQSNRTEARGSIVRPAVIPLRYLLDQHELSLRNIGSAVVSTRKHFEGLGATRMKDFTEAQRLLHDEMPAQFPTEIRSQQELDEVCGAVRGVNSRAHDLLRMSNFRHICLVQIDRVSQEIRAQFSLPLTCTPSEPQASQAETAPDQQHTTAPDAATPSFETIEKDLPVPTIPPPPETAREQLRDGESQSRHENDKEEGASPDALTTLFIILLEKTEAQEQRTFLIEKLDCFLHSQFSLFLLEASERQEITSHLPAKRVMQLRNFLIVSRQRLEQAVQNCRPLTAPILQQNCNEPLNGIHEHASKFRAPINDLLETIVVQPLSDFIASLSDEDEALDLVGLPLADTDLTEEKIRSDLLFEIIQAGEKHPLQDEEVAWMMLQCRQWGWRLAKKKYTNLGEVTNLAQRLNMEFFGGHPLRNTLFAQRLLQRCIEEMRGKKWANRDETTTAETSESAVTTEELSGTVHRILLREGVGLSHPLTGTLRETVMEELHRRYGTDLPGDDVVHQILNAQCQRAAEEGQPQESPLSPEPQPPHSPENPESLTDREKETVRLRLRTALKRGETVTFGQLQMQLDTKRRHPLPKVSEDQLRTFLTHCMTEMQPPSVPAQVEKPDLPDAKPLGTVSTTLPVTSPETREEPAEQQALSFQTEKERWTAASRYIADNIDAFMEERTGEGQRTARQAFRGNVRDQFLHPEEFDGERIDSLVLFHAEWTVIAREFGREQTTTSGDVSPDVQQLTELVRIHIYLGPQAHIFHHRSLQQALMEIVRRYRRQHTLTQEDRRWFIEYRMLKEQMAVEQKMDREMPLAGPIAPPIALEPAPLVASVFPPTDQLPPDTPPAEVLPTPSEPVQPIPSAPPPAVPIAVAPAPTVAELPPLSVPPAETGEQAIEGRSRDPDTFIATTREQLSRLPLSEADIGAMLAGLELKMSLETRLRCHRQECQELSTRCEQMGSELQGIDDACYALEPLVDECMREVQGLISSLYTFCTRSLPITEATQQRYDRLETSLATRTQLQKRLWETATSIQRLHEAIQELSDRTERAATFHLQLTTRRGDVLLSSFLPTAECSLPETVTQLEREVTEMRLELSKLGDREQRIREDLDEIATIGAEESRDILLETIRARFAGTQCSSLPEGSEMKGWPPLHCRLMQILTLHWDEEGDRRWVRNWGMYSGRIQAYWIRAFGRESAPSQQEIEEALTSIAGTEGNLQLQGPRQPPVKGERQQLGECADLLIYINERGSRASYYLPTLSGHRRAVEESQRHGLVLQPQEMMAMDALTEEIRAPMKK